MREAAVALLVLLLTASFRFLALNGFPDDHYAYLTGAQQMLHGAWPSRDFVDLGAPLTYAASAAAQRVFGEGQLTEAVLMALAFGTAATLTLRAGVVLTGSVLLALVAVLIEVVIFPRTYGYPKVLIYAAAALVVLRYADRPSRSSLVLLAAFTVLAGLIRHDHGFFVAIASCAAVVLSPLPGDRWKGAVSTSVFCGVVLALVMPYAIYVEGSGGLLPHLQRGFAFASLQMSQQRLPIGDIRAHEIWLLLVAWVAPLTALIVVVRRATRHVWTDVRRVGPLILLALVVDAGLIRDLPETRVPDAIVMPALLLAWLVRQAWLSAPGAPAMTVRIASGAVVLLTLWAVSVMGHTPEQLDRIGVFNGLGRLASRFGERAGEMRRPWEGRQAPSAAARALQPFFDYSERCVPRDSRLLVPGFLPEIPSLARRAFAGGQVWFIPGALATPADHALVMKRLSGERVPIAVVRRPTYDDLAIEFPELDAYITARFAPVAQWSLGGDDRITLMVDQRLATGKDQATGWPCFR